MASEVSMTAHERAAQERRTAWRLVLPAMLWTLAFFVAPFACMVAMSLWWQTGAKLVRTRDLENYVSFFARPHFVEGLVDSPEITIAATVISALLAYPLAWFIAERVPERWQRAAVRYPAVPDPCVVRSHAWTLVLAGRCDFPSYGGERHRRIIRRWLDEKERA